MKKFINILILVLLVILLGLLLSSNYDYQFDQTDNFKRVTFDNHTYIYTGKGYVHDPDCYICLDRQGILALGDNDSI